MRNSQSALGNSGMWNWTSSVVNAITAASNLASGSLHMPSGMNFSISCTIQKRNVISSIYSFNCIFFAHSYMPSIAYYRHVKTSVIKVSRTKVCRPARKYILFLSLLI
ncbi:hypothetical protein CsSME_00015766 [Camellia sinensis var. sinensis]